MAVSANRLELLQIADAVAREKSIDREIVLTAMADAIQKAAKSRYGSETNIRADINPKTGEIHLQRLLEVVLLRRVHLATKMKDQTSIDGPRRNCVLSSARAAST